MSPGLRLFAVLTYIRAIGNQRYTVGVQLIWGLAAFASFVPTAERDQALKMFARIAALVGDLISEGSAVESLRGHLLVASSSLKDPNFFQTVVLIVQHGESGALGLVLNRATNATIQQVWQQIRQTPCAVQGPLYLGGPIEGPLVALHTQAAHADLEVTANLFYTVQPDLLEKLVAEPHDQLRFIAGYSGWGPDQLEAEINEGSWIVGPAMVDQVFRHEAHFWEHVRKEFADANLVDFLKIRHVPDDPRWN